MAKAISLHSGRWFALSIAAYLLPANKRLRMDCGRCECADGEHKPLTVVQCPVCAGLLTQCKHKGCRYDLDCACIGSTAQ